MQARKGRSAGSPAAASDLEDAILSLAREIRYAQRERNRVLAARVGQEDAAVDDLDALAGARVQTAVKYLKAIQAPKAICTRPNPAAINRLPQDAGAKSAAAPSAIRHMPMMGTARTENAPPVTMAVP